jgi:hypothetical protein
MKRRVSAQWSSHLVYCYGTHARFFLERRKASASFLFAVCLLPRVSSVCKSPDDAASAPSLRPPRTWLPGCCKKREKKTRDITLVVMRNDGTRATAAGQVPVFCPQTRGPQTYFYPVGGLCHTHLETTL